MPISRGELQSQIYEILSKSPTAFGLLTPTKVNAMIQDSLDYISTKMMKLGGAWLTRVTFANITANSNYVDLPAGLAIINFVKRKNAAGDYVPINFDENAIGVSVQNTVTSTTLSSYRFSSGKLYLEPLPKEPLTAGLMFDGVFYPDRLVNDGSEIAGDLDNFAFINYAKWRAASQLHSLTTREPPPWSTSEMEWKQASLEIIARRFREPTTIRSMQY